jgi:NADPH2:quinone reductase
MKAIRINTHGGPEVMKIEEVPVPVPGAGEAVVKIAAAGVNFIDVYFRTGLYKVPKMPYTPGQEGAGTVTAVGPGVTEVKVGDRVAYTGMTGSYAEYALVHSWRLVQLPASVTFEQGAALMLQGMTAHYLSHSTFPLKPEHKVIVHAGAGGVGLLLTQIASRVGATVFTTVGTEAKALLSREAGAHEVILYTKVDFEAEAKRLTGGKGVDVVYDSVGASTFEKSLNSLRPRGYMVLYGQSSGPVASFDPSLLNVKGSLFLTRPSLAHYSSNRDEVFARVTDLLKWVASGELKLRIGRTFSLAEAATAHRELEGRQTTGKVLLIP